MKLKIGVLTFIILIILFTFSVNSFGFSFTGVNSEKIDIGSDFDDYIGQYYAIIHYYYLREGIYKDFQHYYIISWDELPSCTLGWSGNKDYPCYFLTLPNFDNSNSYLDYDLKENTTTIQKTTKETLSFNNNIDHNYGSYYNVLFYSNFDIYDESNNLVFQRPVLTLGEALEITNPVEMYQTMIHGMIISLIVFLVGLVAFWKAWSLLSKELRKA